MPGMFEASTPSKGSLHARITPTAETRLDAMIFAGVYTLQVIITYLWTPCTGE